MSTKKYVFNFIQNIRIFVEFCHEKRYILGVLSQFLGVTGIIVSEISLYSIYSISDQPISLYSINSIIVCPYGHCTSHLRWLHEFNNVQSISNHKPGQ